MWWETWQRFYCKFLLSLKIQKISKSANICQSYERIISLAFFMTHSVYLYWMHQKPAVVKQLHFSYCLFSVCSYKHKHKKCRISCKHKSRWHKKHTFSTHWWQITYLITTATYIVTIAKYVKDNLKTQQNANCTETWQCVPMSQLSYMTFYTNPADINQVLIQRDHFPDQIKFSKFSKAKTTAKRKICVTSQS